MANETITLPDLYTRVMKVCPELGPPQVTIVGGKFQLAIECVDQAHCAMWKWATDASMPAIESLILTACVRWLADNASIDEIAKVREGDGGGSFFRITLDGPYPHFVDTNSPTIAALLAVETVCKERSHA